jgi:hypothetical protein
MHLETGDGICGGCLLAPPAVSLWFLMKADNDKCSGHGCCSRQSVLAFELTLQISRRVTLLILTRQPQAETSIVAQELELLDTWLDPGIGKCFQNHQKPGHRT